jgi:two-component system response regulator AtoC
VARVAASALSVLITGETGVGKGVFAKQIHAQSPRAHRPLVVVNCAELATSLLEAELFGFERGAFTGATSSKAGMVETADGGTLFLDEIAELDPVTQTKLLQVLGERQVRRLGSVRARAVDIRVVAATNRDLEVECERGAFRRDLYFRLAGMTLAVPPLRDRRAEIEPLARAFMAEFARSAGLTTTPELSPEALAALLRYSWPGNVRELRNAMERAMVLCGSGSISAEHLPVERHRAFAPPPPMPAPAPGDDERRRIEDALAQCGGSQVRAAQVLGISRRTLVTRLSKLGMPRPRKSRE